MKLQKSTISNRNEANPYITPISYYQTPTAKAISGFKDNTMMQDWIESKEDYLSNSITNLQNSNCPKLKYDRRQYQVQSNPSLIEAVGEEMYNEMINQCTKANLDYLCDNKPNLSTYKKKIIEKSKYCLTDELTKIFYTDHTCKTLGDNDNRINLNDYYQTPEILKDVENSIIFNTSTTNNIQNLSVIVKSGNDKSFKYATENEILSEDCPDDSIYNVKCGKRLVHKATDSKDSLKTFQSCIIQDHQRILSDTSIDTIYIRAKEKVSKQNLMDNQVIDEADELKFNFQSPYNSNNNRDSQYSRVCMDACPEAVNNWSKTNEQKSKISFGKLNSLLAKSTKKEVVSLTVSESVTSNGYSQNFKYNENTTNEAIPKAKSQKIIQKVEITQDDLETDLIINNRLLDESNDKGQCLRGVNVSNKPTFKLNVQKNQAIWPTLSTSNDYAKLNTTRNTTIKSNPFNDCSDQCMQIPNYANKREIQNYTNRYCFDDFAVYHRKKEQSCNKPNDNLLLVRKKQVNELEDFTIKVAKKRSVQTIAKSSFQEPLIPPNQAKSLIKGANIYSTEATFSRLEQYVIKPTSLENTNEKNTRKIITIPLKTEYNSKMKASNIISKFSFYQNNEYPKTPSSTKAYNTLGSLLIKSSRKDDSTNKHKAGQKLTKTYNILHPKQQFHLNKS